MRTLLVLLLFAVPALATGPAKLTGPAEVPPGGFASLKADKAVVWVVTPDPVQADERPTELIFTGEPGTTYRVIAFGISADGKSPEKTTHTVKFAGQPARPVVRPPVVAPPAPVGAPPGVTPPRVAAPPPAPAPVVAAAPPAPAPVVVGAGAGPRPNTLYTPPAPGVPAPTFRGLPPFHAGHDCPACGYQSPAGTGSWIVRAVLPGGEHVHVCDRCAAEWRHR